MRQSRVACLVSCCVFVAVRVERFPEVPQQQHIGKKRLLLPCHRPTGAASSDHYPSLNANRRHLPRSHAECGCFALRDISAVHIGCRLHLASLLKGVHTVRQPVFDRRYLFSPALDLSPLLHVGPGIGDIPCLQRLSKMRGLVSLVRSDDRGHCS